MGVKPVVAEWLNKQDITILKELPGARILRLREGVYSVLTRCPHKGGDTWSHIVIGPKKVFVIDTGFGIGDYRGYVERLACGREVIVANTHYHHDHSLGNCQWEKVYAHRYDALMLEHNMYPEFWAESNMDKTYDDSFFSASDLVPFKKYEVVACEDGYKWNLGCGHTMELVWLPGHSSGECGFLDNKNRILFSGDAIMNPHATALSANIRPYEKNPQYSTVTAFRDAIERLSKRTGEFDVLYDGHGILEEPNTAVEDMLIVANDVVKNPNNNYTFTEHGGREVKTKAFGLASIQYIDERV